MAEYRLEAVLEARADTSGIFEFQGALAGLEAQMAGISDEEIDLRVNGSQALAEGAAVRAGLEGIPDESIDVNVNSAGALAEAATVRAGLEAIPDEEIDLKVNAAAATAEVGAFAAALTALGAIDPTVNVRVSFRALANVIGRGLTEVLSAIPRITTGFLQLGASGLGALRGMAGSLSLARVGALNLINGLTGVAAAVVGIVVAAKVFGSLVGIIATIGQLLFGMVAIAGLFAGAVVVGFGLAAAAALALYQIMQQDETAFQGLRNSAQEFGQAFRESFRESATEMAGLAREALEFGTSILPRLGEAATEVVGGIREGFQNLVSDIFPQAKQSAERIFEGLPKVMQDVTTAVGAFGTALTGVLAAAMPVVEDLAGWLSDVARDFASWANSAGGQQAIRDFFKDVSDAMPDIKEGIGSLVDAIKILDNLSIEGLAKGFKNLAQGIEDAANEIQKIIDFGDKIADGLNSAGKAISSFGLALRQSIGETVDQLGKRLTNFRTDVQEFGKGVKEQLDRVGNFFKQLPYKVEEGLSAAIQAVTQFGSNLRTQLTTAFLAAVATAVTFGTQLREKISTGLTTALSAVQEFGSNLRSRLTTAFLAAVASAATFGSNLRERIASGLSNALTAVQQFGSNLRSNLTTAFIGAVAAAAGGIAQIASTVASGFAGIVSTVASAVGEFVSNIASGFGEAVSTAAGFIGELASTVASGFGEVVSTVASAVGEFVSSIASGFGDAISAAADGVSGILSAIGELVGGMAEVGANAMAALASAIAAGASSVISAAADVARAAISAAKDALGISSPSREFLYIGDMISSGLTQAIEQGTPAAVTAAQRMADQIREAVGAMVDDVGRLEVAPRIGTPALAGSPGGLSGATPGFTSRSPSPSAGDSAVAAAINRLADRMERGQRIENAEEVAAYIAQILPGVTESPVFNRAMNKKLTKSVESLTRTLRG